MKRIISARAATGIIAKVAFVGAVVIALNTAPMIFDPVSGPNPAAAKEKKHKSKPGKNLKHVIKGLYGPGGGPPPWAPAHGYRRKQGRAEVSYVPPFDISIGTCNRELIGGVLGGAVGGVLGSNVGKGTGQTVAIVGGTILGVLVGGSIGRTMDQVDQNCVGQIMEHSPTGRAVEWQNPDTGVSYEVVPTQTRQDTQGRYCREYQTTATVGGRTQQVYGTACRQPDGSWQIIS
jgi:surface antigen